MLAESIKPLKEPAQIIQAVPAKENESPGMTRDAVKSERQPDMVETAEIVAEVQKSINMIRQTDLQFSIHGETGRLMVKVMDESTGEVVREIPPEEALDLAANLDAMVGLIFDGHV